MGGAVFYGLWGVGHVQCAVAMCHKLPAKDMTLRLKKGVSYPAHASEKSRGAVFSGIFEHKVGRVTHGVPFFPAKGWQDSEPLLGVLWCTLHRPDRAVPGGRMSEDIQLKTLRVSCRDAATASGASWRQYAHPFRQKRICQSYHGAVS